MRKKPKPIGGLPIEIRFKSIAGFGGEQVVTDSTGRFECPLPDGVSDVYFRSFTSDCNAIVYVDDEGICPRVWRPDQMARYEAVHVSPLVGWLRGLVVTAS